MPPSASEDRGELPPNSHPQPPPSLDLLLRRIEAIERRLGIAPAPPPLPRPVPPAAPPRPPSPLPPPPLPPAPPPPAPKPRTRIEMERLIGGRVFAAVGAIVLVIGAILFLKLALDRGWLRLPPAARCISAAAFGAALLVAAEIARRKINALASAGLFAAGIAIIYGSAWVAYAHYALLGNAPAFALLSATSALGVFVATRAGLLSVGALSLIGAYIAPLIAGAPDSPPAVLPIYLSALLALGLVLSALRPVPFRPLRGLVWWGTISLGSFAALNAAVNDQPLVALAFLAVVWAAVHAELWFAANQNHPAAPAANPYLTWRHSRPILTTFATTCWAAAVGVASVYAATSPFTPPDWFVTGAFAVAASLVSLILAGNLRVLIDTPDSDSQRLGAALLAQGGALLIATFAMALAGWTEVLAGVLLGVAALFAGRWIRSRPLDIYGLAVLSLTLARLLLYDSWARATITAPTAPGTIVLGLSITEWSLLMLGAAAGWAAAGSLLVRGMPRGAWRGIGVAALGIALAVAFAAFLSPHSHAVALFVASSLFAAALFAVANAVRSPALIIAAISVLAAACAAAALPLLSLPESADWPFALAGVVLSRWAMAFILAAAIWAAFALVLARSWTPRDIQWRAAVILTAASAVASLFLSLLAHDSDHAAVAWVWLAFAAGVLFLHRAAPRACLDSIGSFALLATAALWAVAHVQSWDESSYPLALHPGLLHALAIAAAASASARALARWRDTPAKPTFDRQIPLLVAGVLTLVFLSSSLEVRRAALSLTDDPTAQGAAMSIWWGVFGIALIALGFWRRVPLVRHTGLALMALATAKALVYDLAGVPPGWRAASFLGLGLMMLAVAVAYARLAHIAQLPRPSDPGPG